MELFLFLIALNVGILSFTAAGIESRLREIRDILSKKK